MIEKRILNGNDTGHFKIRTLHIFYADNGCLVVDPHRGTTLRTDKKVADDLINNRITDDLAFVLIQRGMSEYETGRPFKEETKESLPGFFLVDMTKNCNLGCIYCFRSLEKEHKTVTVEMLQTICSTIASYSKKYPELKISIQAWGGEPLLELDKIVLMRKIFDDLGMHPDISIETNGTLINRNTASLLIENDIHVGISIDGDALLQDLQRPKRNGAGSYKEVRQGIEALREAGIHDIGSITVVTRNTAARIDEITDHLAKELNIRNLKFNIMRTNDRNREYAISEEQIGAYLDSLLGKLKDLYASGIGACEDNISQRIKNLCFRPNDNICDACGCQGGYRMLSIDSEGYVYPCEMTDIHEFRMGNISEEEETDFSELVTKAVDNKNPYFMDRDPGECENCTWQYFCRGGCKSAAYYDKGTVRAIDHFQCRFNRELYPRLVEIIIDDPDFALYLLNGKHGEE